MSNVSSLINGDHFTCMYCRERKPIDHGVRRSLNEFVDIFHCAECLKVSDKIIREQAVHGLALPEDPVIDALVNDLATKATNLMLTRKNLN